MAYPSHSPTKVEEPKTSSKEVDMGDNASSSDEEPGQLAIESDYDDSDMRIERDDGISRVETGKEKQLQDGRSTLDRVLSRTSAADKDPGPPPDGGFWAWASGKCLLLPE